MHPGTSLMIARQQACDRLATISTFYAVCVVPEVPFALKGSENIL